MSNLVDRYGNDINKSVNINTIYSNELSGIQAATDRKGSRAMQVYSFAQVRDMIGRDKDGRLVRWGNEEPYFYITIQQRIEICRLCSPVLGVVSSRMNKLSGLNFNIINIRDKEDEVAQKMKDSYEIYKEYESSTDLSDITMKAKIFSSLKYHMPDLKVDLSNFNSALGRWKRRLRFNNLDKCSEIEAWLQEPNNGLTWNEFVKKFVFDYMIHGASAIFKQIDGGKVENFDLLPGGTVYRVKDRKFSAGSGYVQLLPDTMQPEIYHDDEIVYCEYLPISARNHSMIPLEALINKITESLFFDRLMAEQADGTKPPEKVAIITNPSTFGNLDHDYEDLDTDEQMRIEQKLNQPMKGAIMTFSGNDVKVVDLSRENTMAIQNDRQRDIKKDVALVFGATNMEMNESGSEGTSGRNTSEAQEDIMQGRAIAPTAKALAIAINRGILPFRYGYGYEVEFELGVDELAERQLDSIKLQNGELTKNDIRDKYNMSSFGEKYDEPEGQSDSIAGDTELNPQYVRQI